MVFTSSFTGLMGIAVIRNRAPPFLKKTFFNLKLQNFLFYI